MTLASGQEYHGKTAERYGNSYAYWFNPASNSQRVVVHTYPYNGREVCNYAMLYDQSKRCALWVAWEMDKTDHADKGVGRHDTWTYDPAIPESWQPNLSSSYGDIYTRGHQVASNDRQTTQDCNKQTFYYSNMTPQVSSLNTGVWEGLEEAIQGLQTRLGSGEKIFVVTGPIFDSGYTSINSCPVPTRYYKCIMRCTLDSSGTVTSAAGCGYLFNNASGAARSVVTIDAVESITGFDFFHNIPDSLESAAEGTATAFFQ